MDFEISNIILDSFLSNYNTILVTNKLKETNNIFNIFQEAVNTGNDLMKIESIPECVFYVMERENISHEDAKQYINKTIFSNQLN